MSITAAPQPPLALELVRQPDGPADSDDYLHKYVCPSCGSTDLRFTDGDTVAVATLPEGIPTYGHLDTSLMVGECKTCQKPCCIVEYGFSSIEEPDADYFCVPNLPQSPDRVHNFKVNCADGASWALSRLYFDTGRFSAWARKSYGIPPEVTHRLPKGPFVVDLHQLGPFKLDDAESLSGPYGVSRCSSEDSIWEQQAAFYQRIATAAMAHLQQATIPA